MCMLHYGRKTCQIQTRQLNLLICQWNSTENVKKRIWTLPRKFDTERRANFCSPRFFSFFAEKLPKSSGITHMVTSNGGHPLHHHLRHSVRLSNSLFNKKTTKPTFTQWPQASALQFTPSGLLGHLFPRQQTEYSLFRLTMFWICPDQY